MQTLDYAKCAIRSVIYAHRLYFKGYNPIIRYGIFCPDTPRELWDERWHIAPNECPQFSHAWLELDTHIIDISCSQFGMPNPLLTTTDDPRYNAIGHICKHSFKLIPDKEDPINWSTFRIINGTRIYERAY